MLTTRTGVVFARRSHEDSWKSIKTTTGKLHAFIPELANDMRALIEPPTVYTSEKYPLVLAAGERRSFTANTIFHDPTWRKKDQEGSLRISVEDAATLNVEDGARVRVETARGSVDTIAEITETLQAGNVTLPNGLGVDYPADEGELAVVGAAPNELTSDLHRDPHVGTPFHKHVPARVTAL
jgi:anaerobic selenocysteine-containing dehydrogenase